MKRPRSPTSALHRVPMCKTCADDEEGGGYLCSCSSPALGPLLSNQPSENFLLESELRAPVGFASWAAAKTASLRRNQLIGPGAFARTSNIFDMLRAREQAPLVGTQNCLQPRRDAAMERWIEAATLAQPRERTLPTSPGTRSTISVAHSPDGKLVASTHGDHTVKVFDTVSGRLLQTLSGHRRTPWTVKFHPTDPMLLASGCLGHEARVWDLRTGMCDRLCYLHREIVSLAFHPHHPWVVLASGRRIYFWRYQTGADATCLIQMQRNVRCVGFTPSGDQMIVGVASNSRSPSAVHYINHREETTVQLQLFDFLPASVPEWLTSRNPQAAPLRPPRSIASHAVLYNDGGFHVSDCGTKLCAVLHEACPRDDIPSERTSHVQTLEETFEQGADSSRARASLAMETSNLASIARRVDSLALRESGEQASGATASTAADSGSPPKLRRVLAGRSSTASSAGSKEGGGVAKSNLTAKADNASDSSFEDEARPSGLASIARRVDSLALRERGGPSGSANQCTSATSATSQQSVTSLRRSTIARGGQGTSREHEANASSRQTELDARQWQHLRRTYDSVSVYRLVVLSLERGRVGKVLAQGTLESCAARGITSVRFSPTQEHILLGYGLSVRTSNPNEAYRIAAVYKAPPGDDGIFCERVVKNNEDDINIASFHPRVGYGIFYGTRQGKLRNFGFGRVPTHVSSSQSAR